MKSLVERHNDETNLSFLFFLSNSIVSGCTADLGGIFQVAQGFPGGSEVKASAWNAGDPGLIPGSGRSPGEGNGNPLQYSCLENLMQGGTW